MELGLEKVVLSPEDRAQIDKISAEFTLSAKQADALGDYVARDGIVYVLEKAEIVRSKPRENAAGAFVVALRDDWKKPASISGEENRQKAELSASLRGRPRLHSPGWINKLRSNLDPFKLALLKTELEGRVDCWLLSRV